MESHPPGVSASDRVVLFDGVCVMCSAGARLLKRIDRGHIFTLGTVQSDEGRIILQWHGLPTESYSSFVLSEGSRSYTKSAALIRIVTALGFPWSLAGVMWVIPRPIRDWFYDLVARNRYRLFGTRQQCVVLDQTDGTRLLSSNKKKGA